MNIREAKPDWDDLDYQWDDLAGTWIRGTVVDRGVTRHAGFSPSENWDGTRAMVWGGKSWYLAGPLVSSRFKPNEEAT